MAWLTQNWILVLAGIVVLVFVWRALGKSSSHEAHASVDAQDNEQQHRHGGHGGHRGC